MNIYEQFQILLMFVYSFDSTEKTMKNGEPTIGWKMLLKKQIVMNIKSLKNRIDNENYLSFNNIPTSPEINLRTGNLVSRPLGEWPTWRPWEQEGVGLPAQGDKLIWKPSASVIEYTRRQVWPSSPHKGFLRWQQNPWSGRVPRP